MIDGPLVHGRTSQNQPATAEPGDLDDGEDDAESEGRLAELVDAPVDERADGDDARARASSQRTRPQATWNSRSRPRRERSFERPIRGTVCISAFASVSRPSHSDRRTAELLFSRRISLGQRLVPSESAPYTPSAEKQINRKLPAPSSVHVEPEPQLHWPAASDGSARASSRCAGQPGNPSRAVADRCKYRHSSSAFRRPNSYC